MIPLSAWGKTGPELAHPILGRVTTRGVEWAMRPDHVLVGGPLESTSDVANYAGVITNQPLAEQTIRELPCPSIHSVNRLDHLVDGDVVALNPGGHVRTLYRIASRHNAIFATDRCNSYCLMCSQPPRDVDDRDRIKEHFRLVDLINPESAELGITGGEPTLFKDDFIELVGRCKERLPKTALHVLSNGRLFYYGEFARRLGAVAHPDIMIGIPLYSSVPAEHDYVVQCKGAFDETAIGLHNLARYGVPVEIRIVTHRLTVPRLVMLAELIYRNFSFAAHVTYMGLEMMGFTIPNVEKLWIDPWDYRRELERAVLYLASRGMRVSIYNHQLCTLPASIWPYARSSISDWKNEYLAPCDSCAVRLDCGGFFASSVQLRRVSQHIEPFTEHPQRPTRSVAADHDALAR